MRWGMGVNAFNASRGTILKLPLLSGPSVRQIFHLEDPDYPVLGGVGLLQHIQLEVFVANLGVSHAVIPRWLSCQMKTF